MIGIYPYITPKNETISALPMFYDVKWDYEKNIPVFRNGEPVIVSGAEAVKSWAARALMTERFRHIIYTRAYGNEISQLIGKSYSDEIRTSEAKRMITECLEQCRYIKEIKVKEVDFDDDKLNITAEINTIYGKEIIYV